MKCNNLKALCHSHDLVSTDALFKHYGIQLDRITLKLVKEDLYKQFKPATVGTSFATKKDNGSRLIVNNKNEIVGKKYTSGRLKEDGGTNHTYKWALTAFTRDCLLDLLKKKGHLNHG